MISITVLFRRYPDQCKVAIGSLDLELGTPTWYEASPILGEHTFNEWEELIRPEVLEFAKRLGLDPATLHGGRLAYSGEIHAMMEFDFDSPTDAHEEDDSLGPCGCVDYHMSDCPTRTGGSGMTMDDYLANPEMLDSDDEYY